MYHICTWPKQHVHTLRWAGLTCTHQSFCEAFGFRRARQIPSEMIVICECVVRRCFWSFDRHMGASALLHSLIFWHSSCGHWMWKNCLAGLPWCCWWRNTFARIFRLTVHGHDMSSPKISSIKSFKAFFNFSKSFTQTLMNARIDQHNVSTIPTEAIRTCLIKWETGEFRL